MPSWVISNPLGGTTTRFSVFSCGWELSLQWLASFEFTNTNPNTDLGFSGLTFPDTSELGSLLFGFSKLAMGSSSSRGLAGFSLFY
jgi:hypothetical protein